MPPQQPSGPNSQYDFIVSPGAPPKKSLLPSLGGQSSFTKKLIFIIGGAVILIILMWIAGSILGGGGSTADLTKLVQQQQEIARVSAVGAEGTSRSDIRNAATNTKLTLTSQEKETLVLLANQGTEVKEDQQKALENPNTDAQLETARSNNQFDAAFLEIMQSHLSDYASTIQAAFDASSSDTEQELLRLHYDQVQLLLKQLPKT